MNKEGSDISCEEQEDPLPEVSLPALRKAIGQGMYGATLEMGCGNKATYRILSSSTRSLYIGINHCREAMQPAKNYYRAHRCSQNLPNSHFLERDVFSLEDKGVLFDLTCMNSLQSQIACKKENDLKRLLYKLLHLSSKLIMQAIVAEELGEISTVRTADVSRNPLDFLRKPLAVNFFPLLLYQGIATEAKRTLISVPGEAFEQYGQKLKTTYLVFE